MTSMGVSFATQFEKEVGASQKKYEKRGKAWGEKAHEGVHTVRHRQAHSGRSKMKSESMQRGVGETGN